MAVHSEDLDFPVGPYEVAAAHSEDFEQAIAGAPAIAHSEDFDANLLDNLPNTPGNEIVVTNHLVNLEEVWVDDVFGLAGINIPSGYPFGSIGQLLAMSNGDGRVRDIAGDCLEISAPFSDTPTAAAIYSNDVWKTEELLRWAIYFEISAFDGPDTTLDFMFFPEVILRQSFERADVLANALHGIRVVSQDNGLTLNLVMFYTDSFGVKQYWDGEQFGPTAVPFGVVLKDRTYFMHIERTAAVWRFEVHDGEADESGAILAIEVNIDDVDPSGGWLAFGDLVSSDPSSINQLVICISAHHRAKGVKPTYPVTKGLSDFITFRELSRPLGGSFSRYDLAINHSDGNDVFTPITRKVPGVLVRSGDNDKFFITGAGQFGRLDLVSFLVYGTTRLWWVLAFANDIDDPLRVPANTELFVPPIETVTSRFLPEVSRA